MVLFGSLTPRFSLSLFTVVLTLVRIRHLKPSLDPNQTDLTEEQRTRLTQLLRDYV